MGFVTRSMVQEAAQDARKQIIEQTQYNNRVLAEVAAEQVAAQVRQRWAILELEASDPELHRLLREARGKLREHQSRRGLDKWLNERNERYGQMNLARSWFVDDGVGRLLAVTEARYLHVHFAAAGCYAACVERA